MTGSIKTKFFDNVPAFQLASGSLYKPVESIVADAAAGRMNPKMTDVDVFAEQVAKDVLSGTNGPIWRGSMASASKFVASYVPKFILVSY